MPEAKVYTDDEVFELARRGFEELRIFPIADSWCGCLIGAAVAARDGEDAMEEHLRDSMDPWALLGRSRAWSEGVSDGFAGGPMRGEFVNQPDYAAGHVLGARGRSEWIEREIPEPA